MRSHSITALYATYLCRFHGIDGVFIARSAAKFAVNSKFALSMSKGFGDSETLRDGNPPKNPSIIQAETIGRLNQKFFGRRAGRGFDSDGLNRVCFQKTL
jgi:hypothetical protein